MARAGRIAIVVLAAWLALAQAWAAPSASQPSATQTEEIEQKQSFVRDLLFRSSIPRHIAAKGNAASKKLLDDAHAAYLAAEQALKAKDSGKALSLFDEATRLVGRASRSTPDLTRSQEERQQRYDLLLRGLEAMLKSHEDHLARLEPEQRSSLKPFDRQAVINRKQHAARLAEAGDLLGAGDVLEGLQDQLAAQLNALIGQAVYVDRIRFDTPSQEYDYELNRFRSLADMLPMANAKFKPNPEIAARMKRLADDGMSGYVSARQMAAKGEFSSAISLLKKSSLTMQRALEIAGFNLRPLPER